MPINPLLHLFEERPGQGKQFMAFLLLCFSLLQCWGLGSEEASPWLIVFGCMFFYSGMLFLLHWQCDWDHCHAEHHCCQPNSSYYCMVEENLARSCVHNSINFEMHHDTASTMFHRRLCKLTAVLHGMCYHWFSVQLSVIWHLFFFWFNWTNVMETIVVFLLQATKKND